MLAISAKLEEILNRVLVKIFPKEDRSTKTSSILAGVNLLPASKPEFGDFQINCALALAKEIKEPPREIAKKVANQIKQVGISSFVDLKNQNLNYKIRDHSLAKIPLLLICGKKEVDSNSVTIRRLDSNKQENMELKKFLKTFSALNKAPSN